METEERTAAHKPFIVLLNLVAWIILITAVVLGAIHVNECPIQPQIPIYLIVIGGSEMILLMLAYWKNSLDEGVWKVRCLICILCVVIFSIVWFLTGTVWVFSLHPPNFNSSAVGHYCHRTLYLFAFWFNILCFVSMCILIPCCACYILYKFISIIHR